MTYDSPVTITPELPHGLVTEDAVAAAFSHRYKDKLRYVATWKTWLRYDGSVWHKDDTLNVFDLVRLFCRGFAARRNDADNTKDLGKASAVAAVERLAKADRRHAATVDIWDADQWLLNTPAGVVDLRTGKMREHRSDDHMTKITAVSPGGDCPLWLKFLHRVTKGDADLIAFLQRLFGYTLTGSTREQVLGFFYGTGNNGKGVLLNTVSAVCGSYAAVAPIETFTESKNDRHPADMAMLQGSRLVTAQETEEGKRWAESKIKALTGGDPVTARFMRQDFFTYVPLFKLIFAGNHKPGLRNVDQAMRRRVHMILFDVIIPKEERDPDLKDKLELEWPGILKWMIEGCLEWQATGLRPPQVVLDATEEYFSIQDSVAIWLDECCKRGSGYETSASLFASWHKFCGATGEFPITQKRLSQRLLDMGLVAKREAGTGRSGFDGITIHQS